MKKSLLAGFTLTETMIAMAVIGIIAAITVPAVVMNYQNKSLVTAFQKNYNEMTQVLTIMSTEAYSKNFYGSRLANGRDNVGIFFKGTATDPSRAYYSVSKDCGTSPSGCFAASYIPINGGSSNFGCTGGYSVLVKSGAAICIVPATPPTGTDLRNWTDLDTSPDNDAHVYIDVNGPDKPNIGGRDMFTFDIRRDYSLKDRGNSSDCASSAFGAGCLANLLENNWRVEY